MMIRISRLNGVMAACVILMVAIVLVGCGAEEPDTIAPEPPAAENGDDGAQLDTDEDVARTLVETKCSGCHALAQVWAADYDRARWEATVARMEANGLQVSADERATIIEYLVEN